MFTVDLKAEMTLMLPTTNRYPRALKKKIPPRDKKLISLMWGLTRGEYIPWTSLPPRTASCQVFQIGTYSSCGSVDTKLLVFSQCKFGKNLLRLIFLCWFFSWNITLKNCTNPALKVTLVNALDLVNSGLNLLTTCLRWIKSQLIDSREREREVYFHSDGVLTTQWKNKSSLVQTKTTRRIQI